MTHEPAPPTLRPAPRDGGRLGGVLAGGAVGLLLLLWMVTLAGRGVRAPPATLALAVTVLPYLYAAVGAVLFGLWCVLPDRRVLPGVLAALFLTATGLWGPSFPARGELAAGEPLRMMNWNLRRLWGGPDDGGDPKACVIAAIEAADPDLLTLLEVSRDDIDHLSEVLGLTCIHGDYFGTGASHVGGLATCVRGDRLRLLGGKPQRFVDDEAWRYVFAEVEVEDRVFNLLAVHLRPYWPLEPRHLGEGVRGLAQGEPEALLDAGRAGGQVVQRQGGQTVALLDRVSRFVDPTIVAGDFNSTPDTSLHVGLRRHLVDAWARGGRGWGPTTRMSGWLPLRIDYVYVTEAFAVGGASVPGAGCSDHQAVVADLVLRDGP